MTAIQIRGERTRPTAQTWADPGQWVPALREFSIRNVGRPVRLEVGEAVLKDRSQKPVETFVSILSDERTRRVEIVLTDTAYEGHHVRTIAGVTSVDLLTGTDGVDLALRIGHAHGRAQTLVTMLSAACRYPHGSEK
jgi:hypothetical protein